MCLVSLLTRKPNENNGEEKRVPRLRGLPFECPWAPRVSQRTPRSRSSRLVVEPPLIEDVFVGICCTRFLRMYIHCVSSRRWPSPRKGKRQNAGPDRSMLVADKLANGEEQKDARGGGMPYATAIAIMGRRQPGCEPYRMDGMSG